MHLDHRGRKSLAGEIRRRCAPLSLRVRKSPEVHSALVDRGRRAEDRVNAVLRRRLVSNHWNLLLWSWVLGRGIWVPFTV